MALHNTSCLLCYFNKYWASASDTWNLRSSSLIYKVQPWPTAHRKYNLLDFWISDDNNCYSFGWFYLAESPFGCVYYLGHNSAGLLADIPRCAVSIESEWIHPRIEEYSSLYVPKYSKDARYPTKLDKRLLCICLWREFLKISRA